MSDCKLISIMGSTGSIGTSALSVIEYANRIAPHPQYQIDALVAGSDASGLAAQAKSVGARYAVIADPQKYKELSALLAGTDIEVGAGPEAVLAAASRPVHRVLAAIVGIQGLASTLAAIRAGNSIALANKESMVCAGALLKREAVRMAVDIVPTDSEHNAMFQVMERREDVERLVLTASGGPFRATKLADMADITVEMALAHPRWNMGRKITIDSATLFNKGLELIEAAYLFDIPESCIDVVVHPQSIIHSLVTYRDGSVLAQMGDPDMRTPISHALSWPDRRQATAVNRLDLVALGALDFTGLDAERFPAVDLCRQALRAAGGAPIVLNSANEVAVAAFLKGQCHFQDISRIVEKCLNWFVDSDVSRLSRDGLDEIMTIDEAARRQATQIISALPSKTRVH
ncbi:MAG: 1-deoxy-D-xylulose-5-phosphate reductoisomerase [Henriciella sp.]